MLKRSRPTVRVLVFVLGVLLAACAQLAAANVEKIIFVVPSLPDGDLRSYPHSPLSNVAPEGASENAAAAAAITSLTPSKPRTTAFVPFTKELAEEGQSRVSRTPVELDGLSVGQRYEVRVCWLASVSFGRKALILPSTLPIIYIYISVLMIARSRSIQ